MHIIWALGNCTLKQYILLSSLAQLQCIAMVHTWLVKKKWGDDFSLSH